MTPESKSSVPTSLDTPNSDRTLETLSPPTDPAFAAPLTDQGTMNTGGSSGGSAPVPPIEVAGYEILGELGHGGMGVVYKARQIKANRLVALKMVLAGKHISVEDRIRFQIETEAVARLQHANIVQLYEVGEHEGLPYFSLEYCEGGTLGERLKTTTLAPLESAALIESLARAVHYAHLHGIVHRDLKPANILLAACGLASDAKPQAAVPKIADFGLAKRMDNDGDSDISKSGAVVGTPSYMAPEQAAGRTRAIGPPTDVYSLGAILYELLTGRAPFRGESVFETLQQVLSVEPTPPSRLRRGVPRDLETICLKCLHKEPGRRYASADDLGDDLRRYRAGEPIQARPVGSVERLMKWAHRKPGIASLLGALAMVLVGAFVLVTWQLRETRAAVAERNKADHRQSQARVATLLEAAPAAVPQVLADLEVVRDDVLPRLRELWQDKDTEPKRRMRAALALLPVEPEEVRDELAAWMLQVDDPAEVVLVRDALKPHGHLLKEALWTKTTDNTLKPMTRFRALVALAAFDPDGERWEKQASAASDRLLSANPLYLGTWVQALRPVRGVLQEPLAKVFREATSPERREFAATVLADYAADRPDVLTDLLLDADPKQYSVLFPIVRKHRAEAVERMRRAVWGEEFWNDAPLDPLWSEPDEELHRAIESAEGILAERWALCQSLPLEKWSAVVEKLRACGYRPIRLRPWASGGRKPPELDISTRLAAVWTRDGRAFHAETERTADAVKEREAHQQKRGFIPVDVAGYGSGDKTRFAALWVKAEKEETGRLHVDVPAMEHKLTATAFKDEGFIPLTMQRGHSADGTTPFCGVWSKGDGVVKETNLFVDDDEHTHKGRVLLAEKLLMDVHFHVERSFFFPRLRFASVWHPDPHRESTALHGLNSKAHLERCRELAYQGYRPAALSVAVLDAKPQSVSVWHRPFPSQIQRERLTRRQATGAVSLLKLDAPSDAWSLYRHRSAPEARSQLIWRGGLFGLDPKVLIARLDEEKDVSARRALILALGEFNGEQLPTASRLRLTEKLLTWYRDDPDPGIHGAIDWLLRHDKEGPNPRLLDWGQAAALKRIDDELKRRDPDGERHWYVNGQGQTMVLIPRPEEFRMGSPLTEPHRRHDEIPHRRRIDRGFGIASRPVTVEEFQRFLKERPDVQQSYVKRDSDYSHYSPSPAGPVICVTWYEAAQYCNWLSEKDNLPESEWCYPRHADIKEGMKPYADYLKRKGYRLPTEAEWEYAARAGSVSSRYYGSSMELLPRYAWFLNELQERTWPVGQKRPNDLGLFDMHGNVWNWTQESVGSYVVPAEGAAEDREVTREIQDRFPHGWRGGSFHYRPSNIRSGCRSNNHPSYSHFTVGFRPARTLP